MCADAAQPTASYFCEKNMMALFWEILQADCGSEVRVQIIQTVSILLQNVRKPIWKCACPSAPYRDGTVL